MTSENKQIIEEVFGGNFFSSNDSEAKKLPTEEFINKFKEINNSEIDEEYETTALILALLVNNRSQGCIVLNKKMPMTGAVKTYLHYADGKDYWDLEGKGAKERFEKKDETGVFSIKVSSHHSFDAKVLKANLEENKDKIIKIFEQVYG